MEDNIYIDEEFVKRYIESAVLPWEHPSQSARSERVSLIDKLHDLDGQLDHLDEMIERGYSHDYDRHHALINAIHEINIQIADTYNVTVEEPDPFSPADSQENQDYDNLDYENDNMMYDQLRRGEG